MKSVLDASDSGDVLPAITWFFHETKRKLAEIKPGKGLIGWVRLRR